MKRTPAETFAHQYGSAERVEWMACKPCVICGRGPCHNAHTRSGGTGRKAHHSTVVPLCSEHHDEYDGRAVPGGKLTFAKKYGLDLAILAEMYQAAWEKYLERNGPNDGILQEEPT